LKNYSVDQNFQFHKLWEIPTHRGNVNCLYVDANYILTGGEDGIVRVWTRTTHELTVQISAHQKDVYSVFADINKPNLIYSCGADRSLNTIDIKLQKKINLHHINNGYICGISQKIDGECEISKIIIILLIYILVSCGYNCNLCVWDFYQTEPIAEFNLNERFYTLKISHNGKYFAMGSEAGEIWIFKLPDFQFVCKSTGHSLRVNSLNWSPDDKQIISVSSDSSVCVWNFYKILN
jgi:WD40 repeat protein